MITYDRYTLPNGLRVIHHFDRSTPMVAVNVLYDTGARDEQPELTGIAHLFEHLMFGGSANVPDFDIELSNAGGSSNAWTSQDFTNFYDILPAVNIETALHLESDRMLALSFNPQALEVQRSVVIEEFKQTCLNAPYGDLMHHLRRHFYRPGHPYSWPVIGIDPSHIAAVTDDDVRRWFYSRYAPNNAVLAIAGNVSPDHCRKLVEKWFGDIPAREVIPRQLPEDAYIGRDADVTATGIAPTPVVAIAYPMDPYGTADYRVADCITDILAAGRSSRLYRNLVAAGDGTVVAADASIIGSEHAGMLTLTARIADADAADRAISDLKGELSALAGPRPVTDHELQRTLNKFESTFAMHNLELASRAANLAMAEMHGEDINRTVELQRQITVADIARVADTIAASPSTTLRYMPKTD